MDGWMPLKVFFICFEKGFSLSMGAVAVNFYNAEVTFPT